VIADGAGGAGRGRGGAPEAALFGGFEKRGDAAATEIASYSCWKEAALSWQKAKAHRAASSEQRAGEPRIRGLEKNAQGFFVAFFGERA
jgi:hypothetical protein